MRKKSKKETLESNSDVNCECDHHKGHVHNEQNPCRTEKFVEGLLKDLEEDTDFKEKK